MMESIKKLLLGIAFLILALIGSVWLQFDAWVGPILFFPCIIIGIILCLRGYFEKK